MSMLERPGPIIAMPDLRCAPLYNQQFGAVLCASITIDDGEHYPTRHMAKWSSHLGRHIGVSWRAPCQCQTLFRFH